MPTEHGCSRRTAAALLSNHDVPHAVPRAPCLLFSHTALGHSGAGSFSNDLFCLDTACQHWHHGAPAGTPPPPRGWLAATACAAGVVVHGGNGVDNQRLADMWLLEMH